MKAKTTQRIALTALAAALGAAFATPALAQEGDMATGTGPASEVSLGAGFVDRDNQRFGQYTGLHEEGAYLLLDIDYRRLVSDTGTWYRLRGRSLGLDSRELRFEHERQGNWGYFIEYDQVPRFDPYTVRTGLQGIGSTAQTIVPVAVGAGAEHRLKTERKKWSLGFGKAMRDKWDVKVSFRNEEKEGARLWGQGSFSPAHYRFLADPIDQTTRQLDAVASYAGERLQLSGGYHATDFDNRNRLLNVGPAANVAGTPAAGLAPIAAMALPPGSQSHQFHFGGGYGITQTTRATFKVAYTRQTQDQDFLAVGPNISGRTHLGGRVDTTFAQLGLAARPLPGLSVLANLRYEDRDDKTPLAGYTTTGAGTVTFAGTNEPRSIETTAGKLEATYALPLSLRVTAGVDYEEKKRNTYLLRSVSHRAETEEQTYRIELRRPIAETLTGGVAYLHSERDGSSFLTNVTSTGGAIAAGSNLIAPMHYADRDRDMVRATLAWAPLERLSLQFRAEEARDEYGTRDPGPFRLGPRKGEASLLGADAALTLAEGWQATAFVSRNDNKFEIHSCGGSTPTGVCPGTGTATAWGARTRTLGQSFGAGMQGKALARLDLGAELSYSRFKDEFDVGPLSGSAAPAGPPASVISVPAVLPTITTKAAALKLYAKYALGKGSGVKLVYAYDRWKSDDWTWNNWAYNDGTTVTQDNNQRVNFIGVQYYCRF